MITEQQPGPQINVDSSYTKSPSSYSIVFSNDAYNILCEKLGLSEEKREEVSITIKPKAKKKGVLGSYNPIKNIVNVHTNYYTDQYERCLTSIYEIAAIKNDPPSQSKIALEGLTGTHRIVSYLKNAPSERSIPFASQMALKGLNSNVNKTFAHEMKHVADFKKDRVYGGLSLASVAALTGIIYEVCDTIQNRFDNPIFIAGAVLPLIYGLGIVRYYSDPVEIRARSFTKENRDLIVQNPVITIFPKQHFSMEESHL